MADLVTIASTIRTGSAPRLSDWLAEHSPAASPAPDNARQAAELVAGSEVFAGPDGHRYSDVGNAHRLIDLVGNTLRYVPRWSRWIMYSGGRWHIDYGDTLAAFSASLVAVELLENLATVRSDPHHLRALLRHSKRSEAAQGIAATLKVASSLPAVAVDHELLDANPALLNVANGTIDLDTGTLRDHDPDDLLTLQSPVAFDAEATAPEFSAFLARILPDPELRAFVQRLAGLALIGDQPEQILPISLGDGANGKSTLTRIIAEVLGDYSVVASRDVLLALKHDTHPTAKADLFRRRFAHSGELPRGARLDEPQVKELTGGDRIKARRMREDHWEFTPSHLLWIHANHRPTIEGTDDGIWRRVLLIPFDVQVPEAERDPKLADRILSGEAPGVLNWALAGLAEYRSGGLRTPDVVRAATGQYREESDTVARFIAESGLVFDPSASMTAADLLARHADWYHLAGLAEPEQANYRRVLDDLARRGVRTGRRSTSGNRVRIWKGLGVSDLELQADEPTTTEVI